MTAKNTGIPYELFVQKVYAALQRTKDLLHYNNVEIKHNVRLRDNGGIDRQFDLYWEYEDAGCVKRAVIECKDYQNGVTIDRVDALIGKMLDFPDIKPILVTSNKYQQGAKEKAKNHGIDLMVIREEDIEKDWVDKEGNPLIRTFKVSLTLTFPLQIKAFSAYITEENALKLGIAENGQYARNDLVCFGDKQTGEHKTVLELQKELSEQITEYTTQPKVWRKKFKEGYVEYNGKRVPIEGIAVQYVYPPPVVEKFDLEPEVKAVFEYVLKDQKDILMNLGGDVVVKTLPL